MNGQQDKTTWSFLGEHDCQLTVSPDKGGAVPPRAVVTIDDAGLASRAMSVPVPAAMVAGLAAALHVAAGRPVPLILDRPDADLRAARSVAGVTVTFSGRDGIVIRAAGAACLRPGPARELAAVIAAYADAAENEPDPGDVRALAAVIEGELGRLSGQAREMSAVAAVAALHWMQRRAAS